MTFTDEMRDELERLSVKSSAYLNQRDRKRKRELKALLKEATAEQDAAQASYEPEPAAAKTTRASSTRARRTAKTTKINEASTIGAEISAKTDAMSVKFQAPAETDEPEPVKPAKRTAPRATPPAELANAIKPPAVGTRFDHAHFYDQLEPPVNSECVVVGVKANKVEWAFAPRIEGETRPAFASFPLAQADIFVKSWK